MKLLIRFTVTFLILSARLGAQEHPASKVAKDFSLTNESTIKQSSLVLRSAVEPLAESAYVSFGGNRGIEIEPGLRLSKMDGFCTLSTHNGCKIVFEAKNDNNHWEFQSPVLARITILGWEIASSTVIHQSRLVARCQTQDDTDGNLKAMQESARKIRSKPKEPDKNKKLRVRWLFSENPVAGSDVFNSEAIQQLSHLSPIGF